MSAERESFKEIDDLVRLKDIFLKNYISLGRRLIVQAIHEFMLEHPEVWMLAWEQYECEGSMTVYGFGVYLIKDGAEDQTRHDKYALEDRDPKLSKCLKALGERMEVIDDVMGVEFGLQAGSVKITQRMIRGDVAPGSIEAERYARFREVIMGSKEARPSRESEGAPSP